MDIYYKILNLMLICFDVFHTNILVTGVSFVVHGETEVKGKKTLI